MVVLVLGYALTFTEWIEITVLFLIFLDQICQKWIKLDQTFWPETAFWQYWLFCRNCFSSKNTCVKFEVAFWLEKAFFK